LFKYDYSRESESKFAIIVSKKISKKAIERNKIRRKIYAVLRLNLTLIQQPINCVIIPHKHILEFDYQDIEAQLVFFLNKISKNHLQSYLTNSKKIKTI